MLKTKTLLFTGILLFFGKSVLAQCDTNRLNADAQRILEMCYTDPDKAIKQADLLRKKAIECGENVYEIRALIRKGIAYDVKAQFDNSIQEYQRALILSNQAKYQKGIASSENNLGLIYWKKNQLKEAITYFNKAKLSFEELGDFLNTGTCLNNIGLIYEELYEPKKAIEYFNKSIVYYKKAKDDYYILDAYSNLGISFESSKQVDSSMHYSGLAISGYRKTNNKYGLAMSLSNLALAYKLRNKLTIAMDLFKQSANYSREIGNDYSYASAMINLADTYFRLKKYEEAKDASMSCYEIAVRLKSQELIFKSANLLSRYYIKMNDFKKAEFFYSAYTTANSAYTSELLDKRINNTNVLYDIKSEKQRSAMIQKQKDLEIAKVNSEKRFYTYMWIGSILFLLTITGLFIVNNRRTALKKEFQAHKRVYEATNEERKRISYDLHDMVGSQLSFVVNNLELLELELPSHERVGKTFQMGQEAMASLRDTVWALHAEEPDINLLVERMQFIVKKWLEDNGVKVNYVIDKENDVVNAGEGLHILRVFQEIITNIYKHARATQVDISIVWTTEGLELEVVDNGQGFELSDNFVNHYGIESMKHRALKIGAEITLNSTKNAGTKVFLSWKNTTNA